ncbi:Pycsar system effector family protein [Kitasatospora sp. NPDC002227]|uniref:Pycsar system effector family protein n=1 Tax=Kitasatospora sp. NPDC002227 TaxID=3154773 RepID=UPI0033323FD9
MTSPSENDNAQILARTLLAETREELTRADQKAGLLLAALGVALGAVASAVSSAATKPYQYGVFGQILFWVGCLAATVSLALLGSAVRPRLPSGPTERLHSFVDLASGTLTPEQIRGHLTDTDPLDRDIAQLAALARSVATKYRRISDGMTLGAASLVLLLAGLLVGSAA